mmetsp:Transcript_7540/g.19123  ORF Transcript_7540/g.19123 Transcript_7540/m.19123 type:complete len:258 (+) Transcript_7540:1148-1921(+)
MTLANEGLFSRPRSGMQAGSLGVLPPPGEAWESGPDGVDGEQELDEATATTGVSAAACELRADTGRLEIREGSSSITESMPIDMTSSMSTALSIALKAPVMSPPSQPKCSEDGDELPAMSDAESLSWSSPSPPSGHLKVSGSKESRALASIVGRGGHHDLSWNPFFATSASSSSFFSSLVSYFTTPSWAVTALLQMEILGRPKSEEPHSRAWSMASPVCLPLKQPPNSRAPQLSGAPISLDTSFATPMISEPVAEPT